MAMFSSIDSNTGASPRCHCLRRHSNIHYYSITTMTLILFFSLLLETNHIMMICQAYTTTSSTTRFGREHQTVHRQKHDNNHRLPLSSSWALHSSRSTDLISNNKRRRRNNVITTSSSSSTRSIVDDILLDSNKWMEEASSSMLYRLPTASSSIINIPNVVKQRQQQAITTTTTTAPDNSATTTTSSSIPNLTISLMKQIIGGCILALPSCVASLGHIVDDHNLDLSFVNMDTVIPLSIGIIASIGIINAYFFTLIGKVCDMTNATTFQEAWEYSVNKETSIYISLLLTIKTTLSCLAYSIILGDSFANILNHVNIIDHVVSRIEAFEYLSIFILLPICMTRDISSLTPFSFIGLIMVLITSGIIVYRSVDGSYTIDNGLFSTTTTNNMNQHIPIISNTAEDIVSSSSSYTIPTVIPELSTTVVSSLPEVLSSSSSINMNDVVTPMFADVSNSVMTAVTSSSSSSFDKIMTMLSNGIGISDIDMMIPLLQGIAVFSCTLISSFVAHYNAPRFYNELNKSNNNNNNNELNNNELKSNVKSSTTLSKFNIVTGVSYLTAISIFSIVAISGYNTFGLQTLPFILNNYNSVSDPLVMICHIAITLSIIMTFPLPFVGLRDGIIDILQNQFNIIPSKQQQQNDNDDNMIYNSITIVLLSSIVTLSSYITDLNAILAIGGGTFATTIVAILPTIMFYSAVHKQQKSLPNTKDSTNINNRINKIDTSTSSSSFEHETNNNNHTLVNRIESYVAVGLMSICVLLSGTGVTIAVQNIM